MTVKEFWVELRNWRWTNYKMINIAISISSLLIYEFLGRSLYRPYVYANSINDFHIADTLGNSLGTVATIFFFVALLSNNTAKGNFLIKLVTFSVILFEISHPLLGKPIDIWDIIATLITGSLCYFVFNLIFSSVYNENK